MSLYVEKYVNTAILTKAAWAERTGGFYVLLLTGNGILGQFGGALTFDIESS